jgi:hypothetical protein
MKEFQLTEKANFPENPQAASLNLALALGIAMEFMDNIVRSVNDDPEIIEFWEIGRGLQASSEIYFMSEAKQ